MGYRDGDDPELARWATKQRSEHKRGQLHSTRSVQNCIGHCSLRIAHVILYRRKRALLGSHVAKVGSEGGQLGWDGEGCSFCAVLCNCVAVCSVGCLKQLPNRHEAATVLFFISRARTHLSTQVFSSTNPFPCMQVSVLD